MELKPVRTNDQACGRGAPYEPAQEAVDVAQTSKVLRNTYLLLAATMVPTVIGAAIGIQTSGIILANPIISFFVMLGAVIGLQFGIAANRNSGIGVALLLLMTGLLDRKSTRLNSSHANISYAVFCLKKKKRSSLCRAAA